MLFKTVFFKLSHAFTLYTHHFHAIPYVLHSKYAKHLAYMIKSVSDGEISQTPKCHFADF